MLKHTAPSQMAFLLLSFDHKRHKHCYLLATDDSHTSKIIHSHFHKSIKLSRCLKANLLIIKLLPHHPASTGAFNVINMPHYRCASCFSLFTQRCHDSHSRSLNESNSCRSVLKRSCSYPLFKMNLAQLSSSLSHCDSLTLTA